MDDIEASLKFCHPQSLTDSMVSVSLTLTVCLLQSRIDTEIDGIDRVTQLNAGRGLKEDD